MIPDSTISQSGPLINAVRDCLLQAQKVSDLDGKIQCLVEANKFIEEAINGLEEQKYYESLEVCPECGYEHCSCDETSCYEDWEVEHCWLCWEPLMSNDLCPVCGDSEEGNWVAWLEVQPDRGASVDVEGQ